MGLVYLLPVYIQVYHFLSCLVSAELTDEFSLVDRVSGFSLCYKVLPKKACPIYLTSDIKIFHS